MSTSGEQEFTTEIAASVEHCFATITNFDEYPKWFSSIEQARVLTRYEDGLGKRVEFHIDMKLRTIRYVLEYHYERPSELAWMAVEGDIESIEGTYRFETLGPQRSRAPCRPAVS